MRSLKVVEAAAKDGDVKAACTLLDTATRRPDWFDLGLPAPPLEPVSRPITGILPLPSGEKG